MTTTEDDLTYLAESDQNTDHRLRRAAYALRDPLYRKWFICQVFSASGSMTQAVAGSWLILQMTGRALDIGYLGVVTWGPTLLLGAWAGGVVDRFDQRRLLIATQSLFILFGAAQTVLVGTGSIQLWMIMVFGALNGLVQSVDGPARQVYVFQLVGPARLASAVGLYEVMLNAARVFGPAMGGLLLATVGTAACFLVNTLSFVPTLTVLLRNKPVAVTPAEAKAPREHVRVRDGLAAVARNPQIRSCILIAATGGLVFNLGTTMPLFAQRVLHLGGGGFGALMACFGLGAVPGALMAASAKHEPAGPLIRILALLTGVTILATSMTPVAAGAYIGMGLAGFLSIWLIASANTLVQLRSDPAMRGRVMGIWTMALPGTIPITGMVAAVAATLDPRAGVGIAGVVILATAAGTWTSLADKAA